MRQLNSQAVDHPSTVGPELKPAPEPEPKPKPKPRKRAKRRKKAKKS